MTLVQLRHLIALAEHRTLAAAAVAVHLTQPALSRSIKSLEDELGQPLLDRVGRRLEFTPLGHEVLAHARQMVADADDLSLRCRALAEGRSGALRVGLGSGPGALLMDALLEQVATRHAGWQLEVARGGTAQLVERLRARALDALVVDVRSLVPAPDLQVEGVSELAAGFLVRPGHPLAGARAVGFEAVRAYPIASTPLSDEVARRLVQRYGPQAHPGTCVTLRCEEIASLVRAVERSDAVLLAVKAVAPQLVALRMAPTLDATARFGLVTLARRTPPATLALLRELVDARLRDAGGTPAGEKRRAAPGRPAAGLRPARG
ncbi:MULTISPECIES: LysR family transcriptional regulator [Ramlibacter]|uniref:LysR family transcriptional regulator n=1 Tax=Ramlibacter aquaticus TaxID=2780094 RepID=A0ABR9SC24_9BURK|nr:MULTISPECIES: LysR family transcriptional regulator [Ramlibacter]MBE7939898.1 LysR family transcriptional regulator [Ramlibacter aquaticus]